jgi:hypothetical protein
MCEQVSSGSSGGYLLADLGGGSNEHCHGPRQIVGAGGSAEEKKAPPASKKLLEEKLTKEYGSSTPISTL